METRRAVGWARAHWAVCVALILPTGAAAAVRYVDKAGTAVAPYDSWTTAATNIQQALDVCSAADVVWVMDGVYDAGSAAVPPLTHPNRIVVPGGVVVKSVNGPAHTRVVGEGDARTVEGVRCVYLGYNAVLEGFTLEGGATRPAGQAEHEWETSGGGAIALTGSTLSNCVVRNCQAGLRGGGVFGMGSNTRILACRLENNVVHAGSGGGAAAAYLRDCSLQGNAAADSGGGVDAGIATNCVLAGNRAERGGGASQSQLYLSTVASNFASRTGGGTESSDSYQCRFIANSAWEWGGGAYLGRHRGAAAMRNQAPEGAGFSAADLENCTAVGNASQRSAVEGGSALNTLCYYNDIVSGLPELAADRITNCCAPQVPSGSGNFTNEPVLVSLEYPRLLAGSPCIDAGRNESWMEDAEDLDGEPRRVGSRVDVGSDEWSPGSETPDDAFIVGATQVVRDLEIRLEADIRGVRFSNYVWRLPGRAAITNQPVVYHGFTQAGTVTGELAVTTAKNVVTGLLRVVVHSEYVAYVAPGGQDGANHPYTDPGHPAQTVQAAIQAVPVAGGVVQLAKGDYSAGQARCLDNVMARARILGPITLRGTANREEAVVVGGTDVRGVYLGRGARLENLTVQGADLTAGSGAGCVAEPGAVISNCVIRANGAADYGGGVMGGELDGCLVESNSAGAGGGVFRASAADCHFRGNQADFDGSGGAAYEGAFDRCLFESNGAAHGGAVAAGELSRCRVLNNSASRNGGGLFFCLLDNTLVAGNKAENGGGVYGGEMIHATVVSNMAHDSGGGLGGEVSALNSIVYHNRSWAAYPNVAGNPQLAYCCVSGPVESTEPVKKAKKKAGFLGPYFNGEGMIQADPMLAAPDSGRLLSRSPCRNAGAAVDGLPFSGSPQDLDGELRTDDSPDVGCDEIFPEEHVGPLTAGIGLDYTSAVVDVPLEMSARIDGKAMGCQWSFGDGSSSGEQTVVSHAYNEPGRYQIALTAINQGNSVTAYRTVNVVRDYATFVSPFGGAVYPYEREEDAAHDIFSAIQANRVKGSRVRVAAGRYETGETPALPGGLPNRVRVDKPLRIEGDGAATTIISAASIGACRAVWLGAGASLSGFTIRDGKTREGDSQLGIHDLCGGGVLALGDALVSDCVIASNQAAKGGGIWGGSSRRCWIRDNEAESYGGGAYAATLADCLLSENRASDAGAAYDSRLDFCTVADNVAEYGTGGLVGGDCLDSIVRGNLASGVPANWEDVDLERCCTAPLPDPNPNGCFDADPGFLPAANDYRLAYQSPCIDRGGDSFSATDHEGNPRPLDGDFNGVGAPDIGAHEYDPAKTDTDGDVMVDGFEREHLFDPLDPRDAFLHADGDGQCNRDEYVAGTDPRDGDSFFHVAGMGTDGQTNVIHFPSATGRLYEVRYAYFENDRFVDHPVGPEFWGQPPTNTFRHDAQGFDQPGGSLMYRVRVRKP